MEKNRYLFLLLSRFKLFAQRLNKKRVKQRNHRFNFDGEKLLITILSFWNKGGCWSSVKIAQYLGIPWRMWFYIKHQMVELFELNFKEKLPLNNEELLVVIIFYLILTIKEVIDNSYKSWLFNQPFDQIISDYFDLQQFKFYFNKIQNTFTDLWICLKTAIEMIVCDINLNRNATKILLLDLIAWFETRLLNYENYFNTKNHRFKKYQKLLNSFSNFLFLAHIYECDYDWNFSLKDWIQKEWKPLFKTKITDLINQLFFNQQYQPEKLFKIFYFYLIQYLLRKLKKTIVIVHEFVPNQKQMLVHNFLEIFAQSQITEMTLSSYHQNSDHVINHADLVILFNTEMPAKTSHNMIWINEKSSFNNRPIVNLELCCKAIYFFIKKKIRP